MNQLSDEDVRRIARVVRKIERDPINPQDTVRDRTVARVAQVELVRVTSTTPDASGYWPGKILILGTGEAGLGGNDVDLNDCWVEAISGTSGITANNPSTTTFLARRQGDQNGRPVFRAVGEHHCTVPQLSNPGSGSYSLGGGSAARWLIFYETLGSSISISDFGGAGIEGQLLIITFMGTSTGDSTQSSSITFQNEASDSQKAILCNPPGKNHVIYPGQTVVFRWSNLIKFSGAATQGRWMMLSRGQFKGTDGTNKGAPGLVPLAQTTDQFNFLRGDGTWALPGLGAPVATTAGGTTQGTATTLGTGTHIFKVTTSVNNTGVILNESSDALQVFYSVAGNTNAVIIYPPSGGKIGGGGTNVGVSITAAGSGIALYRVDDTAGAQIWKFVNLT